MNNRSGRESGGMMVWLGSGMGVGLGILVAVLVRGDLSLGITFGAGLGVAAGLLVQSIAAPRARPR